MSAQISQFDFPSPPEVRMTEIKATLDELQANEPPKPPGQHPGVEWVKKAKTHAANRGAYEATLSKDELKECRARGWYVFPHTKRPGNKKKKEEKEKKEKEKKAIMKAEEFLAKKKAA